VLDVLLLYTGTFLDLDSPATAYPGMRFEDMSLAAHSAANPAACMQLEREHFTCYGAEARAVSG